MATNTGGGTTTSLNNTPQAKDDFFSVQEDAIIYFDVMANDLGGNAKVLWSIDNTSDDGSGDLIARDVAGVCESSELGAKISLTSDGKVRYDASLLDSLAAGETATDQFTYAIRMSNGTLSWATVTVTLTGTNDGPVAVDDVGAGNEDTVIAGSVAINDSDVDNGAVLTYAPVGAAPAGFTMDGDGNWTLDASDPAYQHLAAGATTSVVVSYTVSDEHGATDTATLTITVTGVNDAPVAADDTAAVDEDGNISGSVADNDDDADDGAVLAYALADPAPAGLTFNADGSWSFDASSYDSLAEGEELVLTIPYTVTDQHLASDSATLTITVTGTNDVPVAVADEAMVNEDGNTGGSVGTNDDDADNGAVLSYALDDPGSSPVGLVFNPDGSWTFDASSYDYLDQDEELVLVVPYTVTDEHGANSSATLTITVTGTNDAPVAVADDAAVDEDGNTFGNVGANDSDADAGAVLCYALDNPGSAPVGLVFNPDGSWTFDASSYDHLDQDEELVLVVPYTVSDEHGANSSATLTITVTGTNDAPVAVADEAAVDEDGNIGGSVATNDSDADAGAVLGYTLDDPGAAPVGLIFNADGSWTFDASSYDYLDQDEDLVLVVPYTVTDEHGANSGSTLTITVTGTNDAPVAVADDAAVDEDGNTFGNVGANDSDADAGAVLGYTLDNPGSSPVGLVFNSDGSWTFDASSYDYLDQDEELVLVVPHTVTDEHGASSSSMLTITVTGTNDGPVAVADEAAVEEDGNSVGNVGANDSDADADAVLSFALDDPGSSPVGLVFNSDGSWTFDASSYDGLADGEELVLTVPYTVTDEHGASDGATLTITLTGTNDATVFTLLTGANVFENAGDDPYEPETLNLDTTDVDGPDDLFVAVTTPAATDQGYGTYTLTASGEWTYFLDNNNPAVDALNENDMLSDSFTVVCADGTTQMIEVTIQGVNDAAVISGTIAGTVVEATPTDPGDPDATGTLTASDVDNPDDIFIAQGSTATASGYGSYTMSAAGVWTYTLNNANPTVNALATGAFLIDTFTVQSVDGTSQTITVTITGATDAIVVTPPPTETGADPNDFDTLAGGFTVSGNHTATNGADTFTGDGGNQTLNGQGGNDTIYAAGGNDNVNGNNDNDTLYGQAGTDTVSGNNGLDTLYGGSGNDILIGGNDGDTLYGGSGNDNVDGSGGDDIIIGGYGADTLTGGGNNDTFRYLSTLDTNDFILDFMDSGNDQIDLSAIDANGALSGNQAFGWGGTTATANSLWFAESGGNTVLYGDTDGNAATAEFMITLTGFTGFNAFSNPLNPPTDITF